MTDRGHGRPQKDKKREEQERLLREEQDRQEAGKDDYMPKEPRADKNQCDDS